jgi:hypothetical protein
MANKEKSFKIFSKGLQAKQDTWKSFQYSLSTDSAHERLKERIVQFVNDHNANNFRGLNIAVSFKEVPHPLPTISIPRLEIPTSDGSVDMVIEEPPKGIAKIRHLF